LEDEVAPLALSDRFCKACNAYDNSGIIVNCNKDISGIVFSLDLSMNAVEECLAKGFNCIVTHHPAIYGGINHLYEDSPLQAALMACVKNGISVISMHLNFDSAPHGIDYYLMKGIGGDKAVTMIDIEGGSYGRAYDIPKSTLGELVKKVEKEFNTQRVVVYGNLSREIKRAASFCGAGCDDEAIAFAVTNNADVFVSADMKHHHIAELVSR
jgi:dinuclear metal center YbgI/SA1388 family protein